jgi:hypothetical protein
MASKQFRVLSPTISLSTDKIRRAFEYEKV